MTNPTPAPQATTPRIASIDVFRGLTMAVMVFVNDLDGVRDLPWWTHHAKGNVDVMTYVDMVFPFFLFLVGLSIPLSVTQRLKKNPSQRSLWLHVIFRSVALLALGLILANAEAGDPTLMHLAPAAWTLLALLGMALFLSVYSSTGSFAKWHKRLRFLGLVLVIIMFAIFRHTTKSGQVQWIDFSYPEILGLIACTYFAACVLYIPTRRWALAPAVWFLLLVAFSAACAAKWIGFERQTPLYLWPFGDGTLALVTTAGIVTSTIFLGQRRWTAPHEKLLLGVLFGLLNLALGRALTPLGISKIRDTPTWGLYSAGAAILLFTALYWLCDIKGRSAWASFIRPAGANTLVTYLIPDVWFFLTALLGLNLFATHLNAGLPGALRSVVFTILVLWLAGILYRRNIRMQL